MSKRNRSAFIAGGVVAGFLLGTTLALLFLVWAVPEFRYPPYDSVTQVASQPSDTETESAKPEQKPQWRYWVERSVSLEDTFAQWVMAVFAVLATGASIYAVLLLRDTLAATRAANANASDGVETARLSIREQQQTSRRELRAYVCLNSAELLETDRTGFKAKIIFANFGQTPAHDLRIRCREVTVMPHAISPHFVDLRDREPTEPAVIGPTAGCSKTIDNILEESELTAIQKEDYVIWIYGDVRYKDVFGDNWVTSFCLRVWRFGQPTERIGPCEFGNTAT